MCIIISTPEHLDNDTYWSFLKNLKYKDFEKNVELMIYNK